MLPIVQSASFGQNIYIFFEACIRSSLPEWVCEEGEGADEEVEEGEQQQQLGHIRR